MKGGLANQIVHQAWQSSAELNSIATFWPSTIGCQRLHLQQMTFRRQF
jgi:hypothetical protein